MRRLQRVVIRKEFLAVLVMVFIDDMVVGVFPPTFSLYATSLGASLTLIGALSGVVGLIRIVSSVPIGIISDRKGRRGVMTAGMLLLAGSSYLYTVVTDPVLLVPFRIMYGLTIASTFFIGIAHVGDVTPKHDRGIAIGVYTTTMGLGFTVGSALAGRLAADYGYHFTFRLAAFAALIGAAVVWWGLDGGPHEESEISEAAKPSLPAQLGMLAREPHLFAASLGYGLIVLMFDAAVVNFFPLYATALTIDQTTIGSIFAVRALVSTAIRMPVGLLTTRISTRTLMIAALAVGMASLSLICCTGDRTLLTILLAGEGICFGAFLTSGQAFIAEKFTASERGAAMGVYGVAGSVGSAFGPLALGPIADHWGITTVFWLTGVLVLMGILVLIRTGRQARGQGIEG